jgi:regulation of enolase protein 1 (concanavalin A-like superfamily)
MNLNRISRSLLISILIVLASLSYAWTAERDLVLKGWGRVIDPDGDCTFEAGAKGSVSITIPAIPHDLSYSKTNSGQNSPRVLQEVDGDFIIRVKVTGEFEPGEEPAVEGIPVFQSAGLLLWVDDNHFIRLERDIQKNGAEGICFAPLLEQWKNKRFVGETSPVESSEFFKGTSTYLQLERIGNKVTARISHDGTEWISYTPIQVQLPRKVSIGVVAINTAKQPFKVTFDDRMLFVRTNNGVESDDNRSN